MVTYRLAGGDIDVFLDTDASVSDQGASREFFITDIRSEDSIDIMSGFDIGIQQYSEGQLSILATDKGIELYSFDAVRKSRCVVMQMASSPAGLFNGVSSYMRTPVLTLSDGTTLNYPIDISFIFRISQEQFDGFMNDIPFALFSTDLGEEAIFRSTGTKNGDEFQLDLEIDINRRSNILVTVTLPAGSFTDTCLRVRVFLKEDETITLFVNDDILASRTLPSGVPDTSTFEFVFGAGFRGTRFFEFFNGIMRNIIISDSTGELVNIPNPSTGANSGSAADATVVDVESVTVIM